MSSVFENLLRTDFMPHGHCYLWKPEILWLNVVSDSLIALAYFSIPFALYYFVKRRTDLHFKGIFLLFSLFIALCGVTHLVSIFVIWHGAYGLHGFTKLATAIVSCITAYKVYSSIPLALQLPNANDIKKAMESANEAKMEHMKLQYERQQDDILRESTDSAHVGILVLGRDGIVVVANNTVCSIFGYTKAELEGRHINLLIERDFITAHEHLMRSFIESTDVSKSMAKNRIVHGSHKNGNKVPVEIRLSRAKHDQKTIFVSLQDISERIEAQQALEQSQSLTNHIIQHLPFGLHIYSLNNKRLQLQRDNEMARSLLEHASLTDFTHHEKTHLEMLALVNQGDTLTKTLAYKEDNQTKTLRLHLFPATENQLVIMFEDITEQKRFEGQLIENESMTRRAINASIAGVYVFDTDRRTNIFINDRYTAITGYKLADLEKLETGIGELIHQEDFSRVSNHLHHLMTSPSDNEVYSIQYRVLHANGHWLWLMAQDAVFERDTQGKPSKLIGSFLDITPLKNMQVNLLSLKDKAEKANHSKSEFLANMSHEIRTPMNAIIGLTDMVLQMDMANKQREYLKKIQVSSRSLLQLLNDILDYSKLEAGKFEIINEPFDLFKLMSNCLHLFSTTAAQKHLTIDSIVSKSVPRFVTGDGTRIAQILNNLLGNAIKFTETGGITFTVDAKVSPVSGSHFVTFSVKDTGIGIAEDKLKNLFQSFSQADSSIERRFGGTGLGLAISKKLTTLLNGELGVKSEVDAGSEFTLTIPLLLDKNASSVLDGKLSGADVHVIGQKGKNLPAIQTFFNSIHCEVTYRDESAFLEHNGEYEHCGVLIVDMTMMSDSDKDLVLERLLTRSLSNIEHGIIFLSSEMDYHDKASDIILNAASAWLLCPFLISDLEESLLNILNRKDTLFSHANNHSSQLAFKDVTILLVEDHPTNQFVATELLNAIGIQVVVAEDGVEGVQLFQEKPFDMVLMDLQMPNMDGFTAASRIRELPIGKTVPIYAMSAAVLASDRERVLEVGMDGHIPKPIVREDLYSLLSHVLVDKRVVRSDIEVSTPDDEANNMAIKTLLASHLIGFDLPTAYGRLGDDIQAYLGLLDNFHVHFANFEDELLQEKNDEKLARKLHTMKGLSLSIGATRLEALVKEAEHLLKKNKLHSLADLMTEFSAVLKRIDNALLQAKPLKRLATEHQDVTLADLNDKLVSQHYMKTDELEAYRPLLEGKFGADVTDEIIQAISNFKYKLALDLMANAADQSHHP